MYWEQLAEQRRLALENTLKENEGLHQKVQTLTEELNTSQQLVEESRNLVEVLTEMLKEADDESIEDDVSDIGTEEEESEF